MLLRLLLLLPLVTACDNGDEKPHVRGSVDLAGEPAFTPDRCASGMHYGIDGAWLFSKGPLTSVDDQYRGALIVKSNFMTYIWPGDVPTDVMSAAKRQVNIWPKDCERFSDAKGHLALDCTIDGRRLKANLDYLCY